MEVVDGLDIVPEPGKTFEADESLYVDLKNPTNATFGKDAGFGIIHFQPAPTPQQVNVSGERPRARSGLLVQTVNSAGCVPLGGEFQLEIDDDSNTSTRDMGRST